MLSEEKIEEKEEFKKKIAASNAILRGKELEEIFK